jgi:hydroxymethylglutaryl-CoA synthase
MLIRSLRFTMTTAIDHGIAAFGLAFPPLGVAAGTLAELRGEDVQKYVVGLGCQEFSLSPRHGDVVGLAAQAAGRALAQWGGDPAQIGLLAVGSESGVDMSRPLSAFVADQLGLRGQLRSYEVKHACYGGTVALRQALEWRAAGASRGKAALVIAADVALYAPADPGEPTQGAGAVAMIVEEPRVAAIDVHSTTWSEPAFDFWRPVGEAFPRVDGKLSLDCYMRAAARCFHAMVGARDLAGFTDELAAMCFHVPFPKMVRKAVRHVAASFGWDEARADELYFAKVDPTMAWNKRSGNTYTASLWTAVARALVGRPAGARISAFSYGSGFGSELLTLTAGPDAAAGAWATAVEQDFAARRFLSLVEYDALRRA